MSVIGKNKVLDSEALKTAMGLKGMNAKQLAEASGLSIDTIHQYMSEKSTRQPGLRHFVQICKALGVVDAGALLKIGIAEVESDKDTPDK